MDYYDLSYMLSNENMYFLYVGNLEQNVSEEDLYNLFNYDDSRSVVSVRLSRDPNTYSHLGYGYVNFVCPESAERVLRHLNFVNFRGKSIRVMYYTPRLLGVSNIFIKNLDKSIDQKAFCNKLRDFGTILRFKVATKDSGESKGFGFVQYKTQESAHKAIQHMNELLLDNKKVYFGSFLQRDSQGENPIFVNVVVKNLPKNMTEIQLNTVFQKFGPTTSCEIKINDLGNSKRFGYVNFVNPDDAVKAVEGLNGKKMGYYKEWFVAKSKKKYEMASTMKHRFKNIAERSQGWNNLCVKKLHKTVTDEILKDFFSHYGTLTSCKVIRDSSGVTKGSGFVAFTKPEEASKAMAKINGEMNLRRKKVYMDLVTSLANATPQQQSMMLGENMYQLVEKMEPESAEKITGMLLEMDQTKVLHLLESLASLKAKVAEAMKILRTVKQQQQQQHSVSNHEQSLPITL